MSHFQPFTIRAAELMLYLPQRQPLLLIDKVTGLGIGPLPSLRAGYTIDGSEPVLVGHFPGRPLWPGVYTIEGLAQTCALLGGLMPSLSASPLISRWKMPSAPLGARGLLARADVKLTRPITPPAELCYEVSLTHVVGSMCRFEVEASVGSESAARGLITVAMEGS